MDIDEFLTEENSDTTSKYLSGRIGMKIIDGETRKQGTSINNRAYARALKRDRIADLEAKLAEVKDSINKLEQERKQRTEIADEYARRFNECTQNRADNNRQ
ncbi:hypothetical protein [Magnetovibrio blakemorei]|uniref:Uncharacterized protein n=1 Tax=Magnetovibrio blakemorei TaxID=28181 RepID=A0A1E5Q3U3_9PROT|nr:hypothetical protein [Magnetovibrio blakemorei]OEJ64244.1 hypothetical protein BEN30_16885 [Magnetovibrio blakemorei]